MKQTNNQKYYMQIYNITSTKHDNKKKHLYMQMLKPGGPKYSPNNLMHILAAAATTTNTLNYDS